MNRNNRRKTVKIPLGKETMELLKIHLSSSHILEGYIFPHLRDESEYDTTRMIVETMENVEIDKRYIFAFIKVGRLITTENKKYVPAEDRKAWKKAIKQYEQLIESGVLKPSDSLIPFIEASKTVINPKRSQTELEMLFDIRNFHYNIVEASRQRFINYDFPGAVFNAYKKVLNSVQEKSGNIKDDGISLVTKVFNPKKPILQTHLADLEGNNSIQEGIMHLFMGAVLSIRNIFAHKDVYLMDVDMALEYLSFASFLCKILEVMKRM